MLWGFLFEDVDELGAGFLGGFEVLVEAVSHFFFEGADALAEEALALEGGEGIAFFGVPEDFEAGDEEEDEGSGEAVFGDGLGDAIGHGLCEDAAAGGDGGAGDAEAELEEEARGFWEGTHPLGGGVKGGRD